MEPKNICDDICTKSCSNNLETRGKNTLSPHGSFAGSVSEEESDNVGVTLTPNSYRDSVEKTLNCVTKKKS